MSALTKLAPAFLIAAMTATGTGAAAKDIGDMATGFYNATLDGQSCILVLGNYGWGSNGRGYAGLSCDTDSVSEGSGFSVGNRIMDLNIGEKSSGTHTVNVPYKGEVVPCKVVTGNYGWGSNGRGYAGLQCKF